MKWKRPEREEGEEGQRMRKTDRRSSLDGGFSRQRRLAMCVVEEEKKKKKKVPRSVSFRPRLRDKPFNPPTFHPIHRQNSINSSIISIYLSDRRTPLAGPPSLRYAAIPFDGRSLLASQLDHHNEFAPGQDYDEASAFDSFQSIPSRSSYATVFLDLEGSADGS